MSDQENPLQPEHVFKKLTWRSTLDLAAQAERFTSWTVTGVAAIAGLLLANLDAIDGLVSTAGQQAAFVLFTFSLVFGVFGKQLRMAITTGVETLNKLDRLLNSDEGQRLMGTMTIRPEELVDELAEPFWWPLSTMILSGAKRGLGDPIASDKRLVGMFSVQLYLIFLHAITGACGILSLALSLRSQ